VIKRDIQVLNDAFTKQRIKMTNSLNQYEQLITNFTNKRWAKQNQSLSGTACGLVDPAFDRQNASKKQELEAQFKDLNHEIK
jgi:hypothetical protein